MVTATIWQYFRGGKRMDKPNVKWSRVLTSDKAVRVLVEPNIVRIQMGHAGPLTEEHPSSYFVVDAEFAMDSEMAYEFGSAVGDAGFSADNLAEGTEYLEDFEG